MCLAEYRIYGILMCAQFTARDDISNKCDGEGANVSPGGGIIQTGVHSKSETVLGYKISEQVNKI